ncbi:hypothetical protein Hanom_Chr16g01466771 [Helianthus anomalus]
MEGVRSSGKSRRRLRSAEKDRERNKFGFIKLSKVVDPIGWIGKLKEIRIEGAGIEVSLAKFDRFGSRIEPFKVGERVSVFARLNGGHPTAKPFFEKIQVRVVFLIPIIDLIAPWSVN